MASLYPLARASCSGTDRRGSSPAHTPTRVEGPACVATSATPAPSSGNSDRIGRIIHDDLHDEGGVRRAAPRRARSPERGTAGVTEGDRGGRGPAARLPRADRGAAAQGRAG